MLPTAHIEWHKVMKGDSFVLMPDTGASQNVCGARWALEIERVWKERGLPVKIFKHNTPKPHGGVGAGQTFSKYGISVPISIGDRIHIYKADILSGANENVPALFGIPDMASLNAVICCKTGKFIIPGPGGFEMKASPGTVEATMYRHSHWLLGVGSPKKVDEKKVSKPENRPLNHMH